MKQTMEQTLTYWELHEIAISLNTHISKLAHSGMMNDAERCIKLKNKVMDTMKNNLCNPNL